MKLTRNYPLTSLFINRINIRGFLRQRQFRETPFSPRKWPLFARDLQSVPPSHPKSVQMSYGPKFGVLFIARIETIVTAIQNSDLIASAPMVRLSNAPPPITGTPHAKET